MMNAAGMSSDTAMSADPGTTIRLFISSTFADFQTERDVLQRRVFPVLRQICASRGFRFQPIDLRWGVSEAASTERQTLRICFDELDRCRALSPDCFLLILLGDRYGSCLLPPTISTAVVERLVPHLAAEERAAFDATYRLDNNAVAAEFVLLGSESAAPEGDEPLRQALARAAGAAGLTNDERLPFEGSATHREIHRGLLGEPRSALHAAGVLCALRSFGASPLPREALAEDAAAVYIESSADAAVRAQRLRTEVEERLPDEQMLRYTVPWADTATPTFDAVALTEAYLGLVRPRLEAVMAARSARRTASASEGQDETARANAAFVAERAEQVVGREAELTTIAAYLADDVPLPLLVTGPAGSGKSTLLAEAVTRAARTCPGATLATYYCGMTPSTGSLTDLLNTLSQALAHASNQPEPQAYSDVEQLVSIVAAQLATATASSAHPLLFIVDALDQLGAHAQRLDWLPPRLAPHVRVIVSVISDRPEAALLATRLPAEHVITLAPLAYDAGRMMLQHILTSAPPRTLSLAQEEAVLAAFAVHGLPLYLRLVAGEARRWRSFDPPQIGGADLPISTDALLQAILSRLEAPTSLGHALVGHALGDLAVARYGLAEVELLDLLARDEAVRDALRSLSPYSPQVDPTLPLPMALWARLLAEIGPLLTEREMDRVPLYTFYHRQLRTAVENRFLAGETDLATEARAARHRALASYFIAQPWLFGSRYWNWRKARELVPQLEGAGDRAGVERALDALADTIEGASSLKTHPIEITLFVAALAPYLFTNAYWRVGERFYTLLLAISRALGDRANEAKALLGLGWLAEHLGRMEEAVSHCSDALTIVRAVGDRTTLGTTLNNMGMLLHGLGRVEEAARHLQEALAIHRAVGDRIGEGITLHNLGTVANDQGRYQDAERYYNEALALARELGDREGEATTLNNLGTLGEDQGHVEEAVRYYSEALTLHREVSDRAGEGSTLTNLGALAHRRGNIEEARSYFEQALVIMRDIGNRSLEATLLGNMGSLAGNLGRYQEAAQYNTQALAIHRETGNRSGEATILNNLGKLAFDMGRLEEARRYFEQALPILRQIGDRHVEAITLTNLGTLADHQGHYEEAALALAQALTMQQEIGDRRGEASTLGNLGTLAHHQGHLEEAITYDLEALAISREVGDRSGEALKLQNLGALAADQGRAADAIRYYTEALTIFRELGDRRLISIVLYNLGGLVCDEGQYEDAARYLSEALAITRELGDRAGEAKALAKLGLLAHLVRMYAEAVLAYEQALTIQRELGDKRAESSTLANLGAASFALGRRDVAMRYMLDLLALARQTGDRHDEAVARSNIGALYEASGDLEQARTHELEALAIYQELELTDQAEAVRTTLDRLEHISSTTSQPPVSLETSVPESTPADVVAKTPAENASIQAEPAPLNGSKIRHRQKWWPFGR